MIAIKSDRKGGHRRGGFRHPDTWKVYEEGLFTKEQLEIFDADKNLSVKETQPPEVVAEKEQAVPAPKKPAPKKPAPKKQARPGK